jgi:hypothetical protein
MQQAYDMSWAEFVIRSIAFKDRQEFEMTMTRSVAYQSYCAQFIFSKKKPLKIDQFWPIGDKKIKSEINEELKEKFIKETMKFNKSRNG